MINGADFLLTGLCYVQVGSAQTNPVVVSSIQMTFSLPEGTRCLPFWTLSVERSCPTHNILSCDSQSTHRFLSWLLLPVISNWIFEPQFSLLLLLAHLTICQFVLFSSGTGIDVNVVVICDNQFSQARPLLSYEKPVITGMFSNLCNFAVANQTNLTSCARAGGSPLSETLILYGQGFGKTKAKVLVGTRFSAGCTHVGHTQLRCVLPAGPGLIYLCWSSRMKVMWAT